MGHEFSGEIVEVGSDVTRVKVGDRVTIEPISCKSTTLIGDYNLDPNLNFVGLAADGGFAKYCVLDGDLWIPDKFELNKPLLQNSLLLLCMQSVNLLELDLTVIFGLGPNWSFDR